MAGFGTQINFDINSALDEAESNGIFSKAEAAKIRKKNADSLSKTKRSGAGVAAGIGEAGKLISDSDTEGTNTASQTLGGAGQLAASGFAIGGPWGAAIGGVVGGVQGALQAKQNRRIQNDAIETERVTNIANIQGNATRARNDGVNNIISNLSRTLVSGR